MQGHIHGLGNVVSSTADGKYTTADAVSSVLDGSPPLPTAGIMFIQGGPKNGANDHNFVKT